MNKSHLKNFSTMKISTFAIILAILTAFYGLGLLTIPVKFMSTYAVTLDSAGVLIARILGTVLASNSILYWLCRNVPASEKIWRYILLGNIFYNGVSTPIAATAVLNGITNSTGWTTVVLQVLVLAVCVYFLLQRKTEAKFA
jgi:hypothetical protein